MPNLICGTYSGAVSAARWITRLHWEFEKVGYKADDLPASQVLQTLNMQCEGDAAIYLDSVPHLSEAIDRANDGQATHADL